MAKVACPLLIALSILLSAAPVRAQSGVARSQFVPYYTVSGSYNATLVLNNAAGTPFDVTPTLYLLEGKAAVMEAVSVPAFSAVEIDMRSWVRKAGDDFAAGSLQLDYQGGGYGLGAVARMVDAAHSLEFDVLARSRQMYKSSRLDGIWWFPGLGFQSSLAVSNTTNGKVNGSLELTGANGVKIKSESLSLAPHETRLVALEALAAAGATLGGISIRHDGVPGALMTHAMLSNSPTGFSLDLPVEDLALYGDTKLEGAGILLGTDFASGTRFRGVLLLRNLATTAMRVSPVLQRGTAAQFPLPPLDLGPGEARRVDVPADAVPDSPEPIGLSLPHTGGASDLAANWFSVDEGGSLVVAAPLRSPARNDHHGGNNAWTLQAGRSPVLYIKNTGAEKAEFVGFVWHDAGVYRLGLQEIGAGASFALDLRQLRDQQVPDVEGHILPLEVEHGQVVWYWHSGPPLVGRVSTMDVVHGVAGNMSCGSCCCNPRNVQVGLIPSFSIDPVGGLLQLGGQKTEIYCDGSSQVFSLPGTSLFWSSSAPSVASVSNSGQVSCVSPGASTISGLLDTTFSQPQGPGECTNPGCECLCDDIPAQPTGTEQETVANVQVTTADITTNTIKVVLSGPPTASGPLQLTVTGPSATQVVNTGANSQGPGTYTYDFNLGTIPIGDYNTVSARWTVNGTAVTATTSIFGFFVMGTYFHTQYNTPNESACIGGPAKAYETSANPTCVFNPITLKSDFINQSWLNGSGITIAFGAEQNEALCFSNGSPPSDAMGRSFRPVSSITGACGVSVDNSTVAKGDDAPLSCGDQVLIVGLGGGTGTIKNVEDRCTACTGSTHLDNYTTVPNCAVGSVPSLGSYLTIRLRF